MDREVIWSHIHEQRRALMTILLSLSAEEWEQDSLCAGWRIRDVAAHAISAPQLHWRDLPGLIARGRGSYNRMIDVDSRLRGRASGEDILAQYAEHDGSRHLAPLTTPLEPLIDVLVHTQDVVRPLGRRHDVPPEAAAVAADRARTARNAWVLGSRTVVRSVRMVATDADWDRGRGLVVEAPMLELLLLCAGRPADRTELHGDGVSRLPQA